MRRLVTLVASVSLATGLVACGGSNDAADETPAPSAPGASADRATTTGGSTSRDLAAVPAALDFRASLIDGTEFDGRGLAGGTVVFWFWSPF